MASLLTTAAVAQTQTQSTGGNAASQSGQRNTSGKDGLQRKGSANPGPKGSPKMQNGVSRNGNTNLSPTSQSNVPPPGGDKPRAAKAGVSKTGSTPKAGSSQGQGSTPKTGGSQSGASNAGGDQPTMSGGSGGQAKSYSKKAAAGQDQVQGSKPTSTSTSGSPTTTAKTAPTAKDKAISAAMMKESAAKRQTLGTAGTNNGNGGKAPQAPMKTQGSTSEGDASVASPGGAQGTRAKEARSVQPKSRAAAMASNARSQSAAAPGSQAGDGKKTGANGVASPGATPVSLTDRAQRDGSYSDAAKRNKTAQGPSKDPLKSGPNGQQTKGQ